MVLNSGCHRAGRHLSKLFFFLNPFATCLTCSPSEYPAFSCIVSFFFSPMPFIVFGPANSWVGWNDTTRGQLRELMENSEGLMRSHCLLSAEPAATNRQWFFVSKWAKIKLWLCRNELRYSSQPPPACVCVRGCVCACACTLRTRAQGRHSAAYSAAVCHRDRVALFGLITTGTFLEFRVRSRRKWLGAVSTLRASTLKERSITLYEFPCRCIGCVSFSFSIWGSVHPVQTVTQTKDKQKNASETPIQRFENLLCYYAGIISHKKKHYLNFNYIVDRANVWHKGHWQVTPVITFGEFGYLF